MQMWFGYVDVIQYQDPNKDVRNIYISEILNEYDYVVFIYGYTLFTYIFIQASPVLSHDRFIWSAILNNTEYLHHIYWYIEIIYCHQLNSLYAGFMQNDIRIMVRQCKITIYSNIGQVVVLFDVIASINSCKTMNDFW